MAIPGAPRAVSLIAIHENGIPDAFPDAVVAEADGAKPAPLKGREDLRDLPLVTIDPADARDHDDACYAEADIDPANPDGHVIWVAIADVANYVRPAQPWTVKRASVATPPISRTASCPCCRTFCPAICVRCTEGVDRAVIAVRMVVDADGQKRGHSFHRALMRSPASLHYEEVQAAIDGDPSDGPRPCWIR